MSIPGLIISLIITLALLIFVVWPLLRRDATRTAPAIIDRHRARAIAYYERVLTNIRDLDEDHQTGKISEDEYQAEREVWVGRGVQILKLLDELDHNHPLTDDPGADDAAIDDAITQTIEKAVANARTELTHATTS